MMVCRNMKWNLKAAEQKADELKASVEGKRKEAVDAVMAMLN